MKKTMLLLGILLAFFVAKNILAMQLFSKSFADNEPLPAKFTCDGAGISPQLYWRDVPPDTKSFVLIVDDPDASSGTWVHWILYNIPADVDSLPEGSKKLPAGTKVGINSWNRKEYGVPCPPSGRHHYVFKLYALDDILTLPDKVKITVLQKAMDGDILAAAVLIGVYR